MLHIALCINDKFVMPAEVLMFSIIKNTKQTLHFHIVYNSISDKNIAELSTFFNNFKLTFSFHDVSTHNFKNLVIREGDRVTLETYFRFLLPDLLSDVDKVLYLDADMICLNNLEKLTTFDLSDSPVAMCYDQAYSHISYFNRLDYASSYGYFNAGVMYINLDYWRKEKLSERLFSFVIENPDKCICHDQDAINALLHEKIKVLPIEYNFQHTFFNIYGWLNFQKYGKKFLNTDTIEKCKWNEILEASKAPVFIHYSAPSKPWHKDSYTPFTKVWRLYYEKCFSKKFVPFSRYNSKAKQIKICIHNILSKLHLISKIDFPMYPEEAKILEEEYIAKNEIL